MIRTLTENDRPAVVQYLNTAPHFNLYMLGNLETLGFGTGQNDAICQFWGYFPEENNSNKICGVLNRYMTGWNLFGCPEAAWGKLAEVIDTHPTQAVRLQDNPIGVESILPYLKRYQASNVQVEELMALSLVNYTPAAPPLGISVRRAVQSDLPALVKFYSDAEQMTRTKAAIERPLRDTRIWIAEWRGTVLSAMLTNAETKALAMIGGVYTLPSARGQGLSRAVCSAICAELLSNRKQPVLYWENPAAGVVYRTLGFKVIGKWRSVRLQPA